MRSKIKYLIPIVVCIISFDAVLFAQGTINGHVRIGDAGTRLEGVTVTTGTDTDVTESDGFFSLGVAAPSTVTLTATYNSNTLVKTFAVVSGSLNWMNFWFDPPAGAVEDFDGNYYKVVDIGAQTWMAENLKVTRFNEGSQIEFETRDDIWYGLNSPAYTYYDNDTSINKHIFGALYNWYAVETENLCPAGWHVPSDDEWTTLVNYLTANGHDGTEGTALKSTSGWASSGNGTDDYGFAALPGGARSIDGVYGEIDNLGYWWSTTEYGLGAWFRQMGYLYDEVQRYDNGLVFGHSVRCLMDVNTPIVNTNEVTNITENTANTEGSVLNEGAAPVTERGVCWSNSENPTTDDDYNISGIGLGDFTINMSSIQPYTTYHARAFATNSYGTAYGNDISFSTLSVSSQDSLALVALYNSTNGLGWNSSTSWLAGPVPDWEGIIAAGGGIFTINLAGNNLSGPIPDELWSLTDLSSLYLSENSITGGISSLIGNLGTLEGLDLSTNLLGGPIPAEIGLLSELVNLNLANNEFINIIPPEIGNLSYLGDLDLSNNEFIGSVPGSLSENLVWLDLSNNMLTGAVPDDIIYLFYVQTIDISDNQLSQLPDLSTLTNLSVLRIENNQFTFEDIEPNIALPIGEFIYSPQARIDVESDATSYLNDEVIFTVNAGGTANQYTWWLEDGLISGPVPDHTLTINPVTPDDAGQYSCEITNSLVPGLILFTNNATLDVIDAIQVTNTNDAGPGSLRGALEYANIYEGYDNIVFNITGVGPHTIQPIAEFPDIIDPVSIDGTTQTGFVEASGNDPATLMIEIDGINLSGDGFACGLTILGGSTSIRGLAINHFGDAGIHIEGLGVNIIAGNHIGTNVAGIASQANSNDGIRIVNSPENIIGGDQSSERNIISGNGDKGIEIAGSSSTENRVEGNYIGLSAINENLGNLGDGVFITAPYNTIGGNTMGSRNIISGNGGSGIYFTTSEATGNQVGANYIGTGNVGSSAIGNAINGVTINNGASGNIVGNGNLISGNLGNGIHMSNTSISNEVIGNFIGLAVDGTTALGNGNSGVLLNSSNNMIGGANSEDRNIISGNVLGVVVQGADANDNVVQGNYLGTNANGTAAVPNTNHGVFLGDGTRNEIGPGNLISGNDIFGVLLIDNAFENKVWGNYIGTNHDGTSALPNDIGVHILRGQNNIIGGNQDGEGNLISGNNEGILIYGAPFPTSSDPIVFASGNIIIGNLIGTNADGISAIGNATAGIRVTNHSGNTTIGGVTKAERNVISGNQVGIRIQGFNNENNIVQGNFIGTDITGTSAVGNGWGMYVYTSNNMIGGIKDNAGNVLSGNTNQGLNIISPSTGETVATNNNVYGNYIGVDVSGRNALGNGNVGLMVVDAHANIIGGPSIYKRNIISGNGSEGLYIGWDGAVGNRVEGNFIGTDESGKLSIGNGEEGILINGPENFIGGTEYGTGNLISGNQVGIRLKDMADGNQILGNIIGLDINANKSLGNTDGSGVAVSEGASGNRIGGKEPGAGNYISGSSLAPGVAIYDEGTDNNLVQGNIIGTNKDREEDCSNLIGVSIYNGASNNLIGGMDYGEGNVIAFNEEEGVIIYNEDGNTDETVGNSILGNTIFSNGEMGIDLGDNGVTPNDPGDIDASPNHLQNYPVLDSIGFGQGEVIINGRLNSIPNRDFTLQFYANYVGDNSTYGEGQTYLGSDTVNTGSGEVSFGSTFQISGFVGQVITATATDPDGNTSEFSMAIGGVKDQVLAPVNRPFEYWVNQEVVPGITGDEDLDAIKDAFQTWSDITTADIEFDFKDTTPLKNASATDGVNLVSFRDEKFPFAPGVLAVSAKTLRMKPGGLVAEILDADVIFNPLFVTDQETPFGIQSEGEEASAYDIQSVATHEIGHVLGMIHTGVVNSTMFYMLKYGSTEERSLELDDIAWASYRYPATDMDTDFGYISGSVVYGDKTDLPAVAGALVLAVDTETLDQVHAYTDADGTFKVPIPLNGDPSNEFWIHIQPLDGDVFGYNLKPGNISPYIFSNTLYTDFPDEFYDENEGNDDNPKAGEALLVERGLVHESINLITNSDLTPPTVEKVTPSPGATEIGVNPEIRISFSEPVDIDAFSEKNCYLECETDIPGETYVVGGTYVYLADSTHKVLMKPLEALKYEKTYTLHIEKIPDLKVKLMDGVFESTFTTDEPDTEAPTIWDVLPKDGANTVYVRSEMTLFFSEPMDKESFDDGFTLSCSSSPDVEGRATWDNDNATVSFKPDQTLEEGTLYSMTMSTMITDLSGLPLENEVVYTFTTTAIAPPEIIYLGPGDLDVDVTVETPVVVDFSEPVNTATLSTSSFKLLDEDSKQAPGNFHFLNSDSRIVFTPEQSLQFDHNYQVTLTTDIYDRSDPPKSLENASVTTFTTAKDPKLPHIMYIDPPSGISGAVVTIGGSGFSPFTELNKVNFDGVEATVTYASLNSLAVLVPVGAYTGPVTVEADGDAADNSMRFYVLQDTQDPEDYDLASAQTGSRPRSVSISPDAGYAYVTNQGDGTVSAINLSSELYDVTTIQVGQEPVDIDIDPDGTRAYVANYLDNTVSVLDIDPESEDFNTWMHDINVGVHPNGLAVSSKQKVYVGNERSLDVSVIDVNPASGGFDRVVRSISTGTSNRSVSVTPDAALVLVTGGNGVSIIDINPTHDLFNTVIRNSSSGTSTRSVTIHPDAGIALVLTDDGDILILDIYPGSGTFGEVRGSVSTGTSARQVTISPDAQHVFVSNLELNTVTVYKLNVSSIPGISPIVQAEFSSSSYPEIGLEYITEIQVQSPYAIAIDPYVEKILVTNYTDAGGVTIIRLKKGDINPITSISELIISLNNALNKGVVPANKGASLMKKLVATSKAIQDGKISKAIGQLNAFINNVSGYMKGGRIPVDLGNAWMEAAYSIIAQLEVDLAIKNNALKAADENSDLASIQSQPEISEVPLNLILHQNYPNPFGYSTRINFEIPAMAERTVPVLMRLYNTSGQVVKTLIHMNMEPGSYSVSWNGNLDDGGLVPDGIYMLELISKTQRQVINLSVIR